MRDSVESEDRSVFVSIFRQTRTFPVSRSEEVRMIRFRLTGPDHHGSNYLIIAAFEIFGSLIE
jgi:hypothetical protein